MRLHYVTSFLGDDALYAQDADTPSGGGAQRKDGRATERGWDAMRRRELAEKGASPEEIERLRARAYDKKPPRLMSDRERELRAKAEGIIAREGYWADENLQADVRKIFSEITGAA